MANLYDKILELKQTASGVTSNPILDVIEMSDCSQLDNLALSYTFINKKIKNILKLSENLKLDFDSKFKSIYDNYSEAMLYAYFKQKYSIEAIPEGSEKTPDFKIIIDEEDIYVELKSMSFSDGNLNYKKVQEDSLNANIEIETRLKQGHKIAFGVYSVDPLKKSNKYSSGYSIKHPIEEIINKIDQNIKREQYEKGQTILIVDIKQLIIPSNLKEASVPFYVFGNSIVSGILWNVTFGKIGNLILKTIEWEGRENIEGELEKEGILTKHPFIKGLIFIGYENFTDRKLIGFFRSIDEGITATKFICDSCEFVNNEVNFYGFDVVGQ